MNSCSYLSLNNYQIAYHQIPGKTPGVIFCGGFMSTMEGIKALALEQFCQQHNIAYIRFDYRGHGQTAGNMQKLTISAWLEDTLAVLDQLTEEPQILIGSSMGMWLASLATLARPNRIKGLIGIAGAPDLTEELIWKKLPEEMQLRLLQHEPLIFPSEYSDKPYHITQQFIVDGRQHLILPEPINMHCPVRLFHGQQDSDVPWQLSLQLAERLQSNDVTLTLIKDGDHRLSRPQDLALIQSQLIGVLNATYAK